MGRELEAPVMPKALGGDPKGPRVPMKKTWEKPWKIMENQRFWWVKHGQSTVSMVRRWLISGSLWFIYISANSLVKKHSFLWNMDHRNRWFTDSNSDFLELCRHLPEGMENNHEQVNRLFLYRHFSTWWLRGSVDGCDRRWSHYLSAGVLDVVAIHTLNGDMNGILVGKP